MDPTDTELDNSNFLGVAVVIGIVILVFILIFFIIKKNAGLFLG